MDSEPSEATYHIGTVSSLTGIDVHRIRAWERRHDAVRPLRSERGTRLYSGADLRRLQLIKAVTDCGDSIGTVARMSDEALRARIADLARSSAETDTGVGPTPKVALLGLSAPGPVESTPDCEFVHATNDTEELIDALEGAPVHVIAACVEALGPDAEMALEAVKRATPSAAILVVYDFAAFAELEKLRGGNVRLVQGPLAAGALRKAIFDSWVIHRAVTRERGTAASVRPGLPERLFSDAQLAQLGELRSSVRCECPNHLSLMITKLLAFERYSDTCAARDPGDAALHAHLREGTGRARHELERLLAYLCEVDGLRV